MADLIISGKKMSHIFIKILSVVILGFGLSSCANIDLSTKTVNQGNLSVVDSVHKLRLGMSKYQVKNIMGSSLISPIFSNDRWDYTNTTQAPRSKIIIHSVALYFKDDRLIKISKN